MKKNLGIFTCLALLAITSSALGAVSYWDFSSGDLTTASGTATMEFRDADAGVTASNTWFMTTDGSYTPHIGGQATSYMYWPATTTAAEGFTVTQNSGDGLMSYTVAMDVLIPSSTFSSSTYTGLFNCSTLNNNDADWFLYRPAAGGSMFVDRDNGNTKLWGAENVMQADTWHRIVMTYNENDAVSDARIYVDGTEVGASPAMFGGPTLRLPTSIPFFNDNGADTSDGCVASIAICDFTMSASEVSALGAPTSAGLSNIVDHPWTPDVPPAPTTDYPAAITASNPLVYLRMNEPAETEFGAQLTNSGTSTITTAQIGLTGYGYTGTAPGFAGVNGLDTVAGRDITGFESDNLSHVFVPATTGPGDGDPSLINLDSSYDNGGTTAYELDLPQATYAFWIKSGVYTQGESFLTVTPDYNGVNYANDFRAVLDNDDNRIYLATEASDTPATPNFAATTDFDLESLYDNEWHFIVATRDGDDASNAALYVDGQAISLTAESTNVSVGYTHRIGTHGTSGGYFTGEMDEIAIWDRALTATEVTALLNAAADSGSTPPAAGDANKDGKVDGSDVTILAGNWQVGVDGLTEATWEMGDFNGDKKVDGSDVTILAGNWQYGVTAAAASVPEPSTLALLIVAAGSLLLWRRK